MENKPLNILLNIDRNYIGQACTLIYSVLDHSPENFDIYIMHTDLKEADFESMGKKLDAFFPGRARLLSLTVGDNILEVLGSDKRWPQVVYYRLFAPFLVNVDRLLYLDSDMVADGDIGELYHMDLRGMLIACAIDKNVDKRSAHKEKIGLSADHQYINSGMILYDAAGIRSRYTLEDLLSCIASSDNIFFPDQDILNIFYEGNTLVADTKFNFICILDSYDDSDPSRKPVIYHFGGEKEFKPWNDIYIGEYGEYFWKYAKKFADYFDYDEFMRHRRLNYFKGFTYHFAKTYGRKIKHKIWKES